MGSIVKFPEDRRQFGGGRAVAADSEAGRVVILPVVRIERPAESKADGRGDGSDTPRPRRRRRSVRQ